MFRSKGFIFSVVLLSGFFLGGFTSSHLGCTPFKDKEEASGARAVCPSGDLINLENTFIQVAEETKPAVVNLRVEKTLKRSFSPWFQFRDDFGSPFDDFFKHFFDMQPQNEYKEQSLGTGVIVDERGYILTNNHVIRGADGIKVMLLDGRKFDGKVVGTDPKTDLALIKVETKESLPAAKLGDSDKVKVGSWAIAIGNPFGLEHTITIGVISAKGRAIGVAEYEDLIQTDASINPGNSGGPLVNIYGQVIGINTAIVASGQGIGFAIPINMATRIIGDLREHGKVSRAWLGVYIQTVTPELAKEFEGAKEDQVMVKGVSSGSPAEKAGLLPGDIILKVNDAPVSSPHELQTIIFKEKIDTRIKLSILRKGGELTIYATLSQMPDKVGEEITQPQGEENIISWRGMTVQNLTPEMTEHFGLDKNERGVIISEIAPSSQAHRSQLRKGDLIKEVNHQTVKDISSFNRLIKKIPDEKRALLVIKRKDQTFFVILGEREGQ